MLGCGIRYGEAANPGPGDIMLMIYLSSTCWVCGLGRLTLCKVDSKWCALCEKHDKVLFLAFFSFYVHVRGGVRNVFFMLSTNMWDSTITPGLSF